MPGCWPPRARLPITAPRESWSDWPRSCTTRRAARNGSPRTWPWRMPAVPRDDPMPERAGHEAAATGVSLALFPADDSRFRDAALLAVELFTPRDDEHGLSSPPRPRDDERLVAAAQAM